MAHHTTVYDNSESSGIQKLVQVAESEITLNALDEARLVHCRIAEALSNALNISVDAVFNAAKPGWRRFPVSDASRSRDILCPVAGTFLITIDIQRVRFQ